MVVKLRLIKIPEEQWVRAKRYKKAVREREMIDLPLWKCMIEENKTERRQERIFNRGFRL